MALAQNETAREIEALEKVEKALEKREKRQRIHHIIIGVLGVLLVASVIHDHGCPLMKKKKHGLFK